MEADTAQTSTAESPSTDSGVPDNEDSQRRGQFDRDDSANSVDTIEHEQYVFQQSPPSPEEDQRTSQHEEKVRKYPESEAGF